MHKDASVNIPNSLFRQLSCAIKSRADRKNSSQVSFAYAYLVAITFLYKYASFVDIGAESYVQSADLKSMLGYNKGTKSIDRILAKGGVLEKMGLIETVRDYPVAYYVNKEEEINGIPVWEFLMRSDIDSKHVLSDKLKKTVKNRNFEIREPLFLTSSYDDKEYGTLYQFERTHEITITEFIEFISDTELDNCSFLLYAFFKSRCKGLSMNACSIALYKITAEIGVDSTTFYRKLGLLKNKKYITVRHGQWTPKQEDRFIPMLPNKYFWKGVS